MNTTNTAWTVFWGSTDPDDDGPAGVREPLRPRPSAPTEAVTLVLCADAR